MGKFRRRRPRKKYSPPPGANPITGVTDAKLLAMIRSSARFVWTKSSRRVFIESLREPGEPGEPKWIVRCQACGKRMGQYETERRLKADGTRSKKRTPVYEIDHVGGLPSLKDIRRDLGEYAYWVVFCQLRLLCIDCHAIETRKQNKERVEAMQHPVGQIIGPDKTRVDLAYHNGFTTMRFLPNHMTSAYAIEIQTKFALNLYDKGFETLQHMVHGIDALPLVKRELYLIMAKDLSSRTYRGMEQALRSTDAYINEFFPHIQTNSGNAAVLVFLPMMLHIVVKWPSSIKRLAEILSKQYMMEASRMEEYLIEWFGTLYLGPKKDDFKPINLKFDLIVEKDNGDK